MMMEFNLVIQSNNNDVALSIGDVCWSANPSNLNPSEVNPKTPAMTLFIFKREGRVSASVFESVYTGRTDEEGNYIYEVVSHPATADLTGTRLARVHLMSARSLKDEVVSFVL